MGFETLSKVDSVQRSSAETFASPIKVAELPL
jgi:hypothetical protein